MRVFLSSLMADYGDYRDAAVRAIESLDHEVIRAEDFGARPDTPQQACLAGVRGAEATVLLLGARYGAPQPSGRSATHEEYAEARERMPVLVFSEQGVELEREQQEFRNEVGAWEGGHFTARFDSPESLRVEVTRGLHRLELAAQQGEFADDEAAARLEILLEPRSVGGIGAELVLAIAPGPRQQLIRPRDVEDPLFETRIQKEATFGPHSFFDRAAATQSAVQDDALTISQDTASIRVDQEGNIVTRQSAVKPDDRYAAIGALIEDDVRRRIETGLRFAAWLLDELDAQHRCARVAPAVALRGAGYLPWRTRREQELSPHQATMGSGGDRIVVSPTPPVIQRPALSQRAAELADDLTVLLRRRVRQ